MHSDVNSKLAWGVGNNPTQTHLNRWRRSMAKVMSPEATLRLHLPRMIREMESFLQRCCCECFTMLLSTLKRSVLQVSQQFLFDPWLYDHWHCCFCSR